MKLACHSTTFERANIPIGLLAFALAALASVTPKLRAVQVPDGFTVETLATNLNAATALAVARDGRLFIADQTGPLRVWKNGRLLPALALDLSGRVDDYWERGFIGATLHPDFPHTPHLFVVYVAKQPFTHHVISRFAMLGDRADPASEFVLFQGDDQKTLGGKLPYGHQGGPISFGADGKLYVSVGEQTAGDPAQSLTTLQGKILRLNSDGSIPPDNPFFTRTTGKYRAIWAYGVRNAFGLALQRESGRMFFTDVGASAFEEVNELIRGANYGWPQAEGVSTNVAFKNPLYAYPSTIGRSIVGAVFYEETMLQAPNAELFPALWRGRFFFGDWAANWIKALDPKMPTNVVTFAKGLDAPVALEVAPDGSLFVLNRGTLWREGKRWQPNTGSLLRIRYTQNAAKFTSPQARSPLPRVLAASRMFDSLTPLRPGDGFVEFQINVPPWQPGVITRRWISLPKESNLRINAENEFEFPAGTIVLQNHVVEKTGVLFETQVMWFDVVPGHSRVARAAAYRWADGRDALLLEDSEVISLPGDAAHRWFSPGAEESLNLDMVVNGFVLSLSPRQLSREQLGNWVNLGWVTPKLNANELDAIPRLAGLTDFQAALELRVRSYLDVNCGACHRPGGPSRGNFDARFVTPLTRQRLLDGELAAGNLGISDERIIVPGRPEKSVLLRRLEGRDSFRMPPVSVNDDTPPIVLPLKQWIEGMHKESAFQTR